MRILHVIDSGGLYGAERVVLSLLAAQRDLGLKPTLMSLGDRGVGVKEVEREAEKIGVDCLRLRFARGLNVRGAFSIESHAAEMGAAVVHCHGYKGDILLGLLPRHRRRIPVIVTMHGWTSAGAFTRLRVYEFLDAFAITRVEQCVAVSHSQLSHPFVRFFRLVPVVIPNGIPPLAFHPERFDRECPEIAEKCRGRFAIVTAGRLSKEKGIDDLVCALKMIRTQGVDAVLVNIGEGPCHASILEVAAKEGVSEHTYLTGYKADAHHFFPRFDALVLPSYTEGLPITLLEAMQAGVPVVATRVGEVPEVLDEGRCGHLVLPGKPDELAKALLEVYNCGRRGKQYVTAAAQRVRTHYSVRAMAGRYLEEYRGLIRPNPQPHPREPRRFS